MKILVTNDDSIKSEGLRVLTNLAKKYGEVFVVAPLNEHSAQSHGINVKGGLTIQQVDIGLNVETYTCDSTPADCVRSAIFGLNKEFDIVFSGINNGPNLGEDIAYSGTVAAATEAALMGKKAIAFSSFVDSFESVVPVFDEIMDYFTKFKLLDKGIIYNVNIPISPKGIKLTKQGSTHFDTRFEKEGDLFFQRGNHRYDLDKDNIDSDVWAIVKNYISITPLNINRTDYKLFELLNN